MLTSEKLEVIRKDMKLALSMVESSHNLQFEIGKITYSSYTFSVKIEAAIGKNGEDADLAKTRWDKECYAFGLTQEDFGRKFKTATGKFYTIVDIRPRATKRPIVAEDDEGTSFVFTTKTVKTAILNSQMKSIDEVNKND